MVELVRSGRTPEELAREFEPTAQSIANWVKQADRDAGKRSDGPTSVEREELIRLRRENQRLRPIRAEPRARLLLGIARARLWVNDLIAGRVTDTHAIAAHKGCSERSDRTNLNLAFLSPVIVKTALAGTLPAGKGITEFIHTPMLWERQR